MCIRDRYYNCAQSFSLDSIIRVTADCPLIDPSIVEKAISIFKNNNYDYVTNTYQRTYPDGNETELFSFSALQKALLETAKVSSMILFIIVASVTFSQILAFSGATDGLLKTIQEIATSQFTILLMMICVLLILGAFMDQVSMVMITIPLFIPLAQFQEIDLLWLCVLMLIVMEISFTTPPFGLLLYVMKGVAPKEITLRQIYLAALPFIMLEFLVLIYLIIEPNTALYLPSLIKTGLGGE